jgi:hypothetical protein
MIYLNIQASKALSKFCKFVNEVRTDSITLQLVSSRIVKKKRSGESVINWIRNKI